MTEHSEAVPTWTREDAEAAARQGWHIFSCHCSDYGPFQVERFDEPEEWLDAFGFVPPTLADDDAAVEAMRAAFEAGAPHAVKAHAFLRDANPIEFEAMRMAEWSAATAAL